MKKPIIIKRLLFLVLSSLLMLSLAACGGKTDEPDTPPEIDTKEPQSPEPVQEPEPEPEPPIPFTDVPEDASYYDTVVWAYENGIVSDGSTFEPDSACTRAQVVMFLWRATGSPEPQTAENPFSDISSSDWYYKPVLWAYENSIVTGTTFNPDNSCTNGETLTFLWRAEGKPAAAVYSSTIALAASGEYYARPVAWADNNGVFDGIDSAFDPAAPCRRADMVSYLYWVTEQWTFSAEDKTVQAEYERIVNEAQLYEVHGSGLVYADYVDTDGDGKVELLTLDSDGDYEVTATATVYANIDGHAGKICEQIFENFGSYGNTLHICTYEGHVSLRQECYIRMSGPYDNYYIIENNAFMLNEYSEEYVDYAKGQIGHRGTAGELTEAEYNAINEKYTNQRKLFFNDTSSANTGVTIYDQGILPTASEHWAAICDQIYASVLNGDFSYFAGHYATGSNIQGRPNDAFLDQNGVLTEQYSNWSSPVDSPISVTIRESGVIHCECIEPTFWEPEDEDGDGEPDLGGYYLEEYYDIYPIGVGEEWVDPYAIGLSWKFYDNLDKVRIHHFAVDGGAIDELYIKVS